MQSFYPRVSAHGVLLAKKTIELDTPFRKGEKVVATRDLGPIRGGTVGKIQLQNGIAGWHRYWVLFEGNRQKGQVDHNDLVRPHQLQQWIARKEEAEQAALNASTATAEVEAGAGADAGSGDGGAASLIPAHLLERSKAAKARLLG